MCLFTDGGEYLCLIAAPTGGTDIRSDHELVVAKLELKLASANRPKATRRLDMEKLRDESYLKEYWEEVTRRFPGIDMAQFSVEEGWRSWRDAVKDMTEKTIGPRKERHRPGYLRILSPCCWRKRKPKLRKTNSQVEVGLRNNLREAGERQCKERQAEIDADMETAA